MNFNEDEKEGYDSHLKWLRIQSNTIKKYEQQARDEGRLEGMIEGKIEGEAIGESKNKARTAEKLINLGFAIKIIVEPTFRSKITNKIPYMIFQDNRSKLDSCPSY